MSFYHNFIFVIVFVAQLANSVPTSDTKAPWIESIVGSKKVGDKLHGHIFAGRYHGRSLVPPPASTNSDLRPAIAAVSEKYFTQPLDHFDSTNTKTWQQRYQVSDSTYKKGGPVFVMIGGEGEINSAWLQFGQMYVNALDYGALMFQPEHRFYGKSHPTTDTSDDNLRYLTTAQALADLDTFIKAMKQQYGIPDAKVVVFGGSYPGNLVAWYREYYPDSTVGGVASSAPVLAKVDFFEYIETVGDALKSVGGQSCYDAVKDAFQAIQDLVAAQNTAQLHANFRSCEQLNYNDANQIQMYYKSLMNAWQGFTQYNEQGSGSKLALSCQIMTQQKYGQNPIDRYATWIKQVYSGQCISTDYQGPIDLIKESSWSSIAVTGGSRQWIWQVCNELGYTEATDSDKQPFGNTISLAFLQYLFCTGPFGTTPTNMLTNADATYKRYGGKQPNVTNVFFLNGSLDPWHPLGIYEQALSANSPMQYIQGTSHCYDMQPDQPNDPPALRQARRQVTVTLGSWLGMKPPNGASAMRMQGWFAGLMIVVMSMLRSAGL